MFVRMKSNPSGSKTVQVVQKTSTGRLKIIKNIGTSKDAEQLDILKRAGKAYIYKDQGYLFSSINSPQRAFENIENIHVLNIGFHEVYGRLYTELKFDEIFPHDLIKDFLSARLAYPTSKLSVARWIERNYQYKLDVYRIYRMMDKLDWQIQEEFIKRTFELSKQIHKGEISMVFFDATTLHFESFKVGKLHKKGFSKVGKHNQPQLVIGLLVTSYGIPIGYEVFPGDKFDGHTIRTALNKIHSRYGIKKVTFVADAGMLSKKNLELLTERKCKYIMAAKLKGLTTDLQNEILSSHCYERGELFTRILGEDPHQRLIVSHSVSRARQDKQQREDNIRRIKKKLISSRVKVTKSNVGKYGKSKYFELTGESHVQLNYKAIKEDEKWDGLKGYLTNICKKDLSHNDVIARYTDLWQVESAFRCAKHDLKIRPIFHFTEKRIRSHILLVYICLFMTKYVEYKLMPLGMSVHRLNEYLRVRYAVQIDHPNLKEPYRRKTELIPELEVAYRILFGGRSG